VRTLSVFYQADQLVGLSEHTHVTRVLAAFLARPAVQRGLDVPKR
jgi:GST-like protein